MLTHILTTRLYLIALVVGVAMIVGLYRVIRLAWRDTNGDGQINDWE